MLVLTRKRSEKIQIGEDIVIKVIKTGKGTVKLGIEAPGNVRVMRAELCDDAPVAPRVDEVILDGIGNSHAAMCVSDQFPHAV